MKRSTMLLGLTVLILALASLPTSTPGMAAEPLPVDAARAALVPMTDLETMLFIMQETGVMVFTVGDLFCADQRFDSASNEYWVVRYCVDDPGTTPCVTGYVRADQLALCAGDNITRKCVRCPPSTNCLAEEFANCAALNAAIAVGDRDWLQWP